MGLTRDLIIRYRRLPGQAQFPLVSNCM
jgi:hypothetical protein